MRHGWVIGAAALFACVAAGATGMHLTSPKTALAAAAGDMQISVRPSTLTSRGPILLRTQELVALRNGKQAWIYLPSTLPEAPTLPPHFFAEFTAVALRFETLRVENGQVLVTYRQGTPETDSYGIVAPDYAFQESGVWHAVLDAATGHEISAPQPLAIPR